jgi:hypothetical protein
MVSGDRLAKVKFSPKYKEMQIFESSLFSRHRMILIYMAIARPSLYYGSESWTSARDGER